MYRYICKECGKEFCSKTKNRQFCSQECCQKYKKEHKMQRERKSLVKVVCAECGKIEFVSPSRAKKYVCCSKKCIGLYNSRKWKNQVELTCPICGKKYSVMKSKVSHFRTCGDPNCKREWLKQKTGIRNSNFKTEEKLLAERAIRKNQHDVSKTEYLHVVKLALGLKSISKIPKGYVVHHKDCNHMNNEPTNLVLLPKTAHRLIHTWFGNIMVSALHTNKVTREEFFKFCTDEQRKFYEQIIDLNITNQAVVKQGELLEKPEEANQQPSIYRNIYEGSTTNTRVLTDDAEDSNGDTSALPTFKCGDDIV